MTTELVSDKKVDKTRDYTIINNNEPTEFDYMLGFRLVMPVE